MNIATLANSLPKIKKEDLIDRLVRYYNDHGLNDGEDRELQELLAFAYKQFLPSVRVNRKDDFSWVAQAVADKNDPRYYLRYIYCDGDRIMATNGHILFIVPNSYGLDKGYYDKAKNKVDCDAEYPNIDRVIPSVTDRNKKVNVVLNKLTLTDDSAKFKGAILNDAQGNFVTGANFAYLKMIGLPEFHVLCGEPTDSILYKEGDRLAVIMPIRM